MSKKLVEISLLEEWPFFLGFPQEKLRAWAAKAERLRVNGGDQLLQSGIVNEDLYFLVNGEVILHVNGYEVGRMHDPGSMIGEMSVICKIPTTADVFVNRDSEFLKLPASILDEDEGTRLMVQTKYSQILVDKLQTSNLNSQFYQSQLKDVEASLREVNENLERMVDERTQQVKESYNRLEQQNLELSASQEQLKELALVKRTALSKLDDLYQRVLPALETHLTQMAATVQGEAIVDMVNLKLEVTDVISMIRPLAEKASTEQSIRSKRVLVSEEEKKQQIVIKMAMGGSGVDLSIATNVLEARKAFDEQNFDLVLANVKNVEVLEEAIRKQRGAKLVLITPPEIKDFIEVLEKHPLVPNVISRDSSDRAMTSRSVLATVQKLLSKDIFGMEKYLAWGVEVFEWKVTNSHIRSELIEKMREVFTGLGVRRSFLDRCALVSEEMLMNAIYDAPVDQNGNAKYNHMDRVEEIHLTEDEQSYYRIACDGSFLAISVADPFGALTKDILLKYLRSCYEGHAGVYNTEKGGAGRGLHQIVETSDLVVFNVKKGFRTEVISLFNLDTSQRDKTTGKGFHFFFD